MSRYICTLIEDNHLRGLEKILIVVPGLNSLPGILKLHVRQRNTFFSSKSNAHVTGAHCADHPELLSQLEQVGKFTVVEC